MGTAQPTARTRCLPAAGWLVGAGLLALLALLVLVPGVARAHATLLSSSPRGGQQLGTAPGVVVLQFSQPLDPRLSPSPSPSPTRPAPASPARSPAPRRG